MWVRGLGWERIPRGLRRRSNRGDSFSPPSVLAAEMMSACGKPPLKTPKNQFPAVASDRAILSRPRKANVPPPGRDQKAQARTGSGQREDTIG